MREHPNVGAIRRGYLAFSSGDVATMRSLWTDDLVYHVRGAGELDGDYDGPYEVLGFLPGWGIRRAGPIESTRWMPSWPTMSTA
jgi:ketosteroid isomerase-like protein